MIKYIFPTQKPHRTRQNKEKDEKKIYKNKPVRLYNWNQPIRHIEHKTKK